MAYKNAPGRNRTYNLNVHMVGDGVRLSLATEGKTCADTTPPSAPCCRNKPETCNQVATGVLRFPVERTFPPSVRRFLDDLTHGGGAA